MSRKLTPEQLAKREALKNRTTEEVYNEAVKRGLESNVAAERVAAIKAYADERNPGITEMKDKVKIAEDRAAKAEAALSAITGERDTAQGILCIAIQSALRLPGVESELATLRAGNDEWKAEQTKLLVEEAKQCQWKSERARNEAEEKLREANNTVAASGWTELRANLAELIARHGIPQPDFWSASKTLPPAYWELWGWSAVKARVYSACKRSYDSPSEAFKAQLLRHLKATLPLLQTFGGEPPAPISDLPEKVSCMTEQAKNWDVWTDIESEFTQIQVERQAEHLREHYAMMHAEEQSAAQRGEGRTPIGETEPESSVPVSEHLEGCVCKICSPNLRRLGSLDVIGGEENF